MRGSVRVSFAGTWQEARNFAKRHKGLTAPKGLAHGGDQGLPMLCATYKSSYELDEKQALLVTLGWDKEFHCVVPNGLGFKADGSNSKYRGTQANPVRHSREMA